MPLPALEVLDSFKRGNENPIEKGWKKLFGHSTAGKVESEKYHGEAVVTDGAWWVPGGEYTEPAVAAFAYGIEEMNEGEQLWLLANIQAPEASESELLLLLRHKAGEAKTRLAVELYLGEVGLLKRAEIEAPKDGDGFAFWPHEGQTSVWYKPGAGAWEELFKTATVLAKGFIGVTVASSATAAWSNFSVTAQEPIVEKPSTQHSIVGVEIIPLAIKAEHTTEYKVEVEGLPEGLSINSETGKITGTPIKVETRKKVKVVVKGPGGTASTEFEWVIEAASATKKNQSFMIL